MVSTEATVGFLLVLAPVLWAFELSPARAFASRCGNRSPQVLRIVPTSIGQNNYLVEEESPSDSDSAESTSDWEEQGSATDDDNTDDDPLADEFRRWSQRFDKTLESLTKKQTSLANELEKANALESTVHRAQLLTSNMYLFTKGVKRAVVQDWENGGEEVELTLNDKYSSASEEADALFRQVRKLKRGSEAVKTLLEETAEAVATMEEIGLDLNACLTTSAGVDESIFLLVQDRLIRSSQQTGFSPPPENDIKDTLSPDPSRNKHNKKPVLGSPASNVRKLLSPGGCIVLVGRNRRGNEHLTFTVARGDDIWMHSRGCPGAHVLIQQRRGSPPATDACVQFAADLAIFYSDARSERSFDVMSAKPKHLLKPRGAPLGAVKVREEDKLFTGYPDQVANDLKDARKASGQEDAYRLNDKAKHRRQTKDAAKRSQLKRRSKQKEKRQQEKRSNNVNS